MIHNNIIATATDDNFENILSQEPRLVLAWFSAPWCGPCKRMEPILQVLGLELLSKIRIVNIDVETSPKLSEKHQIRALPSFLLFKNSELLDKRAAVMTSSQLREFIEQANNGSAS